MSSDDSISSTLRNWIQTELLYDRPDTKVNDSTELLHSGLLDSLDVLRVVTFVEETFGVEIPDEQVLPASFRNVDSIAKLVAQYQRRA